MLLWLLPTDPIHRSALQVHNREDPYPVWLDGIEKRIGKPGKESATDRLSDQQTGFREIHDGLRTTLDFIRNADPRPGLSDS